MEDNTLTGNDAAIQNSPLYSDSIIILVNFSAVNIPILSPEKGQSNTPLMKNISYKTQSNLVWHFLRKENWLLKPLV